MEFTLTPSASKFIGRMLRMGAPADGGFRLVLQPGGCSGISSEFSIEPAPLEGDKLVVKDGLRLFLPAESRLFLQGATVDFSDTVMSTGFVIESPMQPAGTCSDHHPEPVQLVTLGKLG